MIGCTQNICVNGTVKSGGISIDSGGSIDLGGATTLVHGCASCDSGFKLDGGRCVPLVYTCQNGTPQAGSPAGNNDIAQCASCNVGFLLTSDNSCSDDFDSDGVLNVNDVDDDGDGLIEIYTLEDLNNMRHDLDGTHYDDEADDGAGNEGSNRGCGAGAGDRTTCNGYELMRNLDFANGASYVGGAVNSDWRPNNADPDMATNEGWAPIGDSSNTFATTFEGNGHIISNLYARKNSGDNNDIGFFGRVGNSVVFRNIGIVNYRLYGGSGIDHIGGLVGNTNPSGMVSTSYAIGNADGGAGNDFIGGLVGITGANFSIVASYASGEANGGDGGDNVGGLVGSGFGPITASYATVTVNGDAGATDVVGGLVGQTNHNNVIITASYATGAVDLSGGAGTDYVGGLIGWVALGTTPASYSFGEKSGGDLSRGSDGATKPAGVTTANGLTAANAGTQWGVNQSTTWDWSFGTSTQNPALVVDFNGDGRATWQEFGSQRQ